jgi:hypothetical protein
MKWEYKGIYNKYNMKDIIELPNNSKVQVQDLILNMPKFMREADVLFCDPPCSQGNLTSFYTKADQINTQSFTIFYNHLFKRIDEIKPKHLFIEVFKSNKEIFIEECKKRFTYHHIYNSYYYNKPSNKCWVLQYSNHPIPFINEINNIDEEKIIKWICANFNYNCIGDLCMGKGLVGKYAFLSNKKFVGIELNKKRLALLVDFIKNYKY